MDNSAVACQKIRGGNIIFFHLPISAILIVKNLGVKIQIPRTSILKKRRQNVCWDWFHIDGLSDHKICLAE